MAAQDTIVDAFTELAPRYEQTMERELQLIWGVGYRDLIGQLVRAVPVERGDVVLDMATGTAQIPLSLARHLEGRLTIGLDITPAMLERGSETIEATGLDARIKLVCASAMVMPFSTGFFDVVVCGLGMHHMDVPKVLSEALRVLKKGGRLFLVDVGAPAFWRTSIGRFILEVLAWAYGRTHSSARARAEMEAVPNLRTPGEWSDLLASLGFHDVRISKLFPGRHPWFPTALTMKAVKAAA